MINIFIIDDHEIIIEGIYSLLVQEPNFKILGSVKRPSHLMSALAINEPDVLLMDINLPEKSGLDLCLEVKEAYPALHIIALSVSNQPSIIKKILANGASGYLLKDANKSDIITAIHQVAQGKNYLSFSVAETLKAFNACPELPLITKREREVLQGIAQGYNNTEIAALLFVSVYTVDSHRKNLLTKFGVKNTAALVNLVVTNNLI